jgi:hypothetical protein
MSDLPSFTCPNCGAKYRLVKVEAPISVVPDCEVPCRGCGGPLNGRDGDFFLKYFLVERSKSGKRRAPAAAILAVPTVDVPPVAGASIA